MATADWLRREALLGATLIALTSYGDETARNSKPEAVERIEGSYTLTSRGDLDNLISRGGSCFGITGTLEWSAYP